MLNWCDMLSTAPNLKGRPRKKKLKFKRETSVESDSNESEGGASDKMTPEKERPVNNIIKVGVMEQRWKKL